MSEPSITSAILEFSGWDKPWTFFEMASTRKYTTEEDRQVLQSIWKVACDEVHWQEATLSNCCAVADHALAIQFPWLIADARTQLVRAASYQWL